jgi:hypothetical protein
MPIPYLTGRVANDVIIESTFHSFGMEMQQLHRENNFIEYKRVLGLANHMLAPFNLRLTEIRQPSQKEKEMEDKTAIKEDIGDSVRRVEE